MHHKAMLIGVMIGLLETAGAVTLVMKSDSGTDTTGEYLDGIREASVITNVVEIPGLNISARSGATNQQINVTGTSLGVTIYGSGDDTDAFDPGESMIISFSNRIRINQLDFRGFESNEVFTVTIDNQPPLDIAFEDLANRSTDVFNADWVVSANTGIRFEVGEGSVIGLDGIDIDVLPCMTMTCDNGFSSLLINLDGAPTNYVLQQRADLAGSNTWTSVSGLLSHSTNWIINTSESTGFFRIMPEQGGAE